MYFRAKGAVDTSSESLFLRTSV